MGSIIRRELGDSARSAVWATATAAGRVARRSRAFDRKVVTILPPSDGGNLGDDAMVRGLLSLLQDRHVSAVPYQAPGYGSLIFGREAPDLAGRMAGLAHLSLLARSSETYVIGADVLDGLYSDRKTALRLRFANLAARSGSRTSVVGFSMNADPTATARLALANLDDRVRLVARDDISAERTAEIAGRTVESAADLAFLIEAEPLDTGLYLPAEINIGFVPNYLLASKFGGLDEYVRHARNCLDAVLATHPNVGIILIPHDKRGPDSDFVLAKRLASDLPRERVVASVDVDHPGHVRSIVAQLDALVSGRMHAAIGALGEGTPVAVLGYQDKAEGVLGMFGLEDWVVDPHETLSDPARFVELVERLLEEGSTIRSQIERRLPDVIAAARRCVL